MVSKRRPRQDPGLRSREARDAGGQEVSALKTAVRGSDASPAWSWGRWGTCRRSRRGPAVDFRSDQFSSARSSTRWRPANAPSRAGTAPETLTAIIREEPDPVAQLNPRVPSPVRWLVDRCLSKDPEDRFGTTKDLARDLADVRDHLSEASISTTGGPVGGRGRGGAGGKAEVDLAPRRLAVLVAGAAGLFGGRRVWRVEPPSFKQLTFRRGVITSARFAPDGQTIHYSASWEGNPLEIFISRPESPESRPFGLARRRGARHVAHRASSPSAPPAAARSVRPRQGHWRNCRWRGRVSREVLDDVFWADSVAGRQTAGDRPRGRGRATARVPDRKGAVSVRGMARERACFPGGDLVAFLDHPARGDDGGRSPSSTRPARRGPGGRLRVAATDWPGAPRTTKSGTRRRKSAATAPSTP